MRLLYQKLLAVESGAALGAGGAGELLTSGALVGGVTRSSGEFRHHGRSIQEFYAGRQGEQRRVSGPGSTVVIEGLIDVHGFLGSGCAGGGNSVQGRFVTLGLAVHPDIDSLAVVDHVGFDGGAVYPGGEVAAGFAAGDVHSTGITGGVLE